MARTVHASEEVARLVEKLAQDVARSFRADQPINIVGIRTRGEILAQRLAGKLTSHGFSRIGQGVLDITLYRDDLSEIGPRPMVRPTNMDIAIDAKPLLLVDDVLFTGRSVRAALDALNDFGRPAVIRLAVLVDRGGRELPIQPDFTGLKLRDVAAGSRVNVRLSEVDGADEVVIEEIKV